MGFKLLVADIDGTVVDHNSDGSEIHARHPSKLSILKAISGGKFVTFATGRNYEWAKPVVESFEISIPVICAGGAQIVDSSNGKVIWERRLSLGTAKKIIRFVQKLDVDEDMRIGFGYRKEILIKDVDVDELTDVIYLDLVGISNPDMVSEIMNFIQSNTDSIPACPPSPQIPGRTNVTVNSRLGSKYNALVELQSILGVEQSETIVVGDSSNDLPLFEAGGLKVCVSNGKDELKEAADLIVSSVHEHGVIEVIDNYLMKA